jgi:hypothetical protein
MSIDIHPSPYYSWPTTVSMKFKESKSAADVLKRFPDLAGFRPMLPDMVQVPHQWTRDFAF